MFLAEPMNKPIKVAFLVEVTVQNMKMPEAKKLFASEVAELGDRVESGDGGAMHVDQVTVIKIQPAKDILGQENGGAKGEGE